MNHTYNQHQSSNAAESERLTHARKEMKDAWIGFLIVSFILAVLFGGVWWSMIPRIVLFINTIDKTAKYFRIKEEENKARNMKAYENYQVNTKKSQPVREQPTIITPTSDETPIFCPLCGSKHEKGAKYCSACGTDLILSA